MEVAILEFMTMDHDNTCTYKIYSLLPASRLKRCRHRRGRVPHTTESERWRYNVSHSQLHPDSDKANPIWGQLDVNVFAHACMTYTTLLIMIAVKVGTSQTSRFLFLWYILREFLEIPSLEGYFIRRHDPVPKK